MPKEKNLYDSSPLQCVKCHQKDFFDPPRNYCVRCGSVGCPTYQNYYAAFQTIAETAPVGCPKGIKSTIRAHEAELLYYWYRSSPMIGAIIIVIIFAWGLFFPAKGAVVTADITVFLAFCLMVSGYIFMVGVFNTTKVMVTHTHLTISQTPLPWFHNHQFAINEISQIYVDEKEDNKGYLWYRVRVNLHNGQRYTITPYMVSAEIAFFIANQAHRWVRIVRVSL